MCAADAGGSNWQAGQDSDCWVSGCRQVAVLGRNGVWTDQVMFDHLLIVGIVQWLNNSFHGRISLWHSVSIDRQCCMMLTSLLWFVITQTILCQFMWWCKAAGALNAQKYEELEMWANAQRDGRPAEYRWRPLFNTAKFGWRPLLEYRAVTVQ